MSNLQSFLDKINTLKSDKIEGVLLSSPDTISLEPLNLKQQKDIISNSLGGIKNSLLFTKTLNDIVIESSNNDKLLLCDRTPLIIALRINSIGKLYSDIDLEQVLNNYKNYKPAFKLEDKVVYKTLTAEITIPSLSEENKFLSKLETLIKEDEEDSYNLGIIYSYEVSKFVSRVSIDDIELDLNSLDILDRISVVEKLPLSLTKLVVNFIENYKSEENKLLTINDATLDLNVDFFDIE